MDQNRCRCGHTGDGPHPCHGDEYRCGEPAQRRFYDPWNGQHRASLAGVQPKVSMAETWACDAHWADFRTQMAAARNKSGANGA